MKDCTSCLFFFVYLTLGSVHAAEPFELKDGDRVVLIGSTLIEREQKYGYWEAALTSRWPDRNITFRNLGWSGDTVWGEARAGFGTPADGFKRLVGHTLALKPTVVIIGYGANEAFDGPEGLPRFEKGLNELLDALAPAKARAVLVPPFPMEKSKKGKLATGDVEAHNRNVSMCQEAGRKVAQRRKCYFANVHAVLYDSLLKNGNPTIDFYHHTNNGIHLTDSGYYWSSRALLKALGVGVRDVAVVFPRVGNSSTTRDAKVTRLEGAIARYKVVVDSLPIAWDLKSAQGYWGSVRFEEVPAGAYTLMIDGKPTLDGFEDTWNAGISLSFQSFHPDLVQSAELRQTIIAKNEAYFHRWRPQNETYLFGFRKHEQGKNAAEIPLFDPIVEKLEKEIARLRKPVPHIYELKRETK